MVKGKSGFSVGADQRVFWTATLRDSWQLCGKTSQLRSACQADLRCGACSIEADNVAEALVNSTKTLPVFNALS